jgi:tRNA dimethylallyltransferase
MIDSKQNSKIIAIVGPTASGKSNLAHQLGKVLGSEIVSADSRLIYKKMDIGTAKPSIEERTEIPYHLIDLIKADESYSMGNYLEDAKPIIDNLLAKNKIPIVVGGTGFYLRGLLEGLHLTETQSDPKFRESIKDITTEDLYKTLQEQDSHQKFKMHFNDRSRIIRALEILKANNENLHQNKEEKSLQFDAEIIWVGLNFDSRDKLRAQIKTRAEKMVEQGLIDEVQNLLNEFGELEIFDKTIGYKETIRFLKGDIKTQSELIDLISISSSQYSKRQMTWFRANQKINWLNSEYSLSNLIEKCLGLIDN